MVTPIRLAFLFLLFSLNAYTQSLQQVLRGTIEDKQSGVGLSGAQIDLIKGGQFIRTTSDSTGKFELNVSIGRFVMQVALNGYRAVALEVLVVAGKSTVVAVGMEQLVVELNAVDVYAPQSAEIAGLRSLSIEKTLRVPANYFDPVRVLTAYPGVSTTSDQNNSIIIRGNSPNGLLWRLNDTDIVNPNHLANAGTLSDRPAANGGGVNILSAQMLDRTDFYTGYLPPSFGNVLSGAVDMRLRDGNMDRHEFTAQASLIGIDVAAEGPLKKGASSFIANYRYSTVGLLSSIGVDFGGEVINFQDLSASMSFPAGKRGQLKWFGLAGASSNRFRAKEEALMEEDKDRYDVDFASRTMATGLRYEGTFTNGVLVAAVSLSGNNQYRKSAIIRLPQDNTLRYVSNDMYDAENFLISSNVNYSWSYGTALRFRVGMISNYVDNQLRVVQNESCITCLPQETENIDGTSAGFLLQPFVESHWSLGKFRAEIAGRFVSFSFNQSHAFEPRIHALYNISERTSLHAGYSLSSMLQSTSTYITQGNKDLDFTKAHHVDLHLDHRFSNGLSINTGVFHQQLFDVPIQAGFASAFSALNLLEESVPVNLVNGGEGVNRGIDGTIEKQFFGSHYFLVGGSVFSSTFSGSDGIERSTRFNGRFTANAVYGKEWTREDKSRTIGLNVRMLWLGGMPQSPIDSSIIGRIQYGMTNPYTIRLQDYGRVDLRLSFRKNKQNYTRTFAIDIQNISNRQNEAFSYFDFVQQKEMMKRQLGLIPILVYRVDF